MAINPGRYPDWMMTLFQDLLAWTPTGQKSNYSEGCRPEDLSRAMMKNGDAKNQANVIETHKNRCQKYFETPGFLGAINTLKMMSMKFDVHHHALIHPIVFKLPVVVSAGLQCFNKNKFPDVANALFEFFRYFPAQSDRV